jgi:diacylglycerol kinase (ATP)
MTEIHENLQKQRRGLNRIVHALGYSLQGLKAGMFEPAFKQEALLAFFLLPLSFFVGRNWVEISLLAGSVVFVLIVELLNTGLESAIDRVGPQWHDLSKRCKDLGSAAVLLSIATGEFQSTYRQFADATVIPAMLQKKVTTTAVVVGAGIQSLSGGNAKVLLFVDQSTTSEVEPVAKAATSSVLVGLQKVGDAWLISQLQPS